jgi:endoglucanase
VISQEYGKSRAGLSTANFLFLLVLLLVPSVLACKIDEPESPSVFEHVYALPPTTQTRLYVDPNSQAQRQSEQWRTPRPDDAAAMDLLAAQPVAAWFGTEAGEPVAEMSEDVQRLVSAATSRGLIPVLVAYHMVRRDCGGYSAGGAHSFSDYKAWLNALAESIGQREAIVILEPDAITETECATNTELSDRMNMLSWAVARLKNNTKIKVYVDAGHPNWVPADIMVDRLQKSGIMEADGFALNVSNFVTTEKNIWYGTQISQNLGGKHFVVDTSRNGRGATNEWCNPDGRAIGDKPTLLTGHELVDAFLWIKVPGESDGTCNKGPSAGSWWPEYALGLVRNAEARQH